MTGIARQNPNLPAPAQGARDDEEVR